MTDPDYGVRPCCVPGCETILPRNRELPVCNQCGVKIAAVHLREAEMYDAARAEVRRQDEERDARVQARKTVEPVVYYVRLANDRIKIGYTSRLKQRVADLRLRGPALLAVEPGDRDLERSRHQEFASARIDRRLEDFRPTAALLAHIEALRQRHDLPRWAKLPDTGAVTSRQL